MQKPPTNSYVTCTACSTERVKVWYNTKVEEWMVDGGENKTRQALYE